MLAATTWDSADVERFVARLRPAPRVIEDDVARYELGLGDPCRLVVLAHRIVRQIHPSRAIRVQDEPRAVKGVGPGPTPLIGLAHLLERHPHGHLVGRGPRRGDLWMIPLPHQPLPRRLH